LVSTLRDKPGFLLFQALQRAAAERAAQRGEPYEPSPAEPALEVPAPKSKPRMKAGLAGALGALAVALALFAAWHFVTPRGAPGLKLDYGLDVTRMDASRRSSLPGPDPSK
jgi:hypothetical protein